MTPKYSQLDTLADAVADLAVNLECLQEHVNTLAGVQLDGLPHHVREPLAVLLGAVKGKPLDELNELADDVLAALDGEGV